jgi:hypothetical protein
MSLSLIAIIFIGVNSILLLFLPKKYAALPFLIGACYITLGQGLEIGPFHFGVLRILIVVGIVRVIFKRERLTNGPNSIDKLIAIWSIWALISSIFHEDPQAALQFRLGLAFNVCGIYYLLRIFCDSIDNIYSIARILSILLVPVAFAMIYEITLRHNLFSYFGGVSDIPVIRGGKLRASGPFLHPILAGTVGATSLPLLIGIYRRDKLISVLGIASSFAIIYCSTSSGPILSGLVSLLAIYMWNFRGHMKAFRRGLVVIYILLEIVMKPPAYYIMGKIDLTGSSTGFHRAALIESAIDHLSEWWLAGTDYTRHWMVTGVTWSDDHTDITNFYLHYGVVGGLPLVILFVIIICYGFSYVGKIQKMHHVDGNTKYLLWSFGAALAAHTVTFFSVSYFDQSFMFVYLTIAIISAAMSIYRETHEQLAA